MKDLNLFSRVFPILRELVERDIKLRYRRSILGIAWTVLNPLLMMGVMLIVFLNFFRSQVENYPLYLIIGHIMYGFFSSATTIGLNAMVWNSSLIRKVYIPKAVFPISVNLSALVNFVFSAIALLIVMIITGARVYPTILLFPVAIFYLFLFTMGMSFALSALNVFFRDIEQLYRVILMAWMYMTPIFYTVDIVPDWAKWIVRANPLSMYIEYARKVIMLGEVPGVMENLYCLLPGIIMLALGGLIFHKTKDKFVLYL
jgi:ABC-2 type transport system permease protein